jgi:hypothetical protein
MRVYAHDNHLIQLHGDRIWGIRSFERSLAGTRLLIVTQNTLIREVTLRTIESGEIPARLRYPLALVRDWKVRPVVVEPMALSEMRGKEIRCRPQKDRP